MRRTLLVLLLVAATALPASAAGLPLLPQTAGQRIAYRIAKTTQGANGPLATTIAFSIVRRAGTTLVLERTLPNGTPNLSILNAAADGSLSSADPKTTVADADLNDVLYAVNLANAATHEGDPAAAGSWMGVMPVAPAPHATTAPLVLVPSNVAGTTFDFSGSLQSTLPIAGNPRENGRGNAAASGRGGGFPGGGGLPGGGGFPGGGSGGGRGGRGGQDGQRPGESNGNEAQNDARGPGAIAQTLRIDGHVAAGRVTRVTIAQQRSVMIDGQPFLNLNIWTLTATP